MRTVEPDKLDQFNAPIPGEMLTAPLGERPWQKPPELTTVEEVMLFYSEILQKPKTANKAVDIIENGVTVTALSETLMVSSVMEGKHTVDTGVLVLPFIVEMLTYLCDEANIEYDVGLEPPEEEDSGAIAEIAKEVFDEFKGSVTTETFTGLPEEESKVEEQEPKMRGLMARGE